MKQFSQAVRRGYGWLLVAGCLVAGLSVNAQTTPSGATPIDSSLLDSLTGSSIINRKYDTKPVSADDADRVNRWTAKPTATIGLFAKLNFVVTDYNDDDGNSDNDPAADVSLNSSMTRLWMMGALWNPNLAYRLSATYKNSKTDGLFVVDDIYLNYQFDGPGTQIRVGQFLIPFLREFNYSPMTNYFANYSLLQMRNGELIGRDFGVMLHGVADLEIGRAHV